MPIDEILIQQVQELQSGETCHLVANLIGSYRGAVSGFEETQDTEYLVVAEESEKGLRILLAQLRLKRAGLHS